VVVQCAAYGNDNTNLPSLATQGIGIYAEVGSTIRDCATGLNAGDGIRVSADTFVAGNTCRANGNGGDGAGIHATSGDNRIDGNTVTDNDRGIEVDIAGNLIVRNSASGNSTNYVITGTQTIGPIITATGTITNTNPWANFSF